MTRGTPTRLVVNDYWRAAIVAGAQHLHLGQEDLVDADLNEIRKAGLTLGISTHDDEELATALRAGPLVAIGGIKFEQAAEIFAAGADSIAVVSDVTQNADPEARVRQWLGQSAEAA